MPKPPAGVYGAGSASCNFPSAGYVVSAGLTGPTTIPVPTELAVNAPVTVAEPLYAPWETDFKPLRVAGALTEAEDAAVLLLLLLLLLLDVELCDVVDEVALCGAARATDSDAHRTTIDFGSIMIG